MTYQTPRICSWCKCLIGYATFNWPCPDPTHGICERCAEEQFGRKPASPPRIPSPSEPGGDLSLPRTWLRWARYALALLLLTAPASAGMLDDAQARVAAGEYDSELASVTVVKVQSGPLSRRTVYPIVLAAHMADLLATEHMLTRRGSEANTWAPWSMQHTESRALGVVAGTVVASEGIVLMGKHSRDAQKVGLWVVCTAKLLLAGDALRIAW